MPLGEQGGDVQDPVADRLRLGLGESSARSTTIWLHARSAPAIECDRHPRLVSHEGLEGEVLEPAVLPVPAPCPRLARVPGDAVRGLRSRLPSVLVMKQVWRKPSSMSNRLSWAPGCGRSLRQISLVSSGQAESRRDR